VVLQDRLSTEELACTALVCVHWQWGLRRAVRTWRLRGAGRDTSGGLRWDAVFQSYFNYLDVVHSRWTLS
jgi:hypothetical protein